MLDLTVLYTYHAPNERTLPRYQAAREAEQANYRLIQDLQTSFAQDNYENLTPEGLLAVNQIYVGRVQNAVISMIATFPMFPSPQSEHLHRAVHVALSLFRNALNEAIFTRTDTGRLLAIARTKAQEIRWLTCGVIAIDDHVNNK